MSDDDQKSIPVNFKDAVRFLEEKAPADISCSICNENAGFSVLANLAEKDNDNDEKITAERYFAIYSLDEKNTSNIRNPVMPVIAVGCNNCGHVRFHALTQVQDWLVENPPEEQSENG